MTLPTRACLALLEWIVDSKSVLVTTPTTFILGRNEPVEAVAALERENGAIRRTVGPLYGLRESLVAVLKLIWRKG